MKKRFFLFAWLLGILFPVAALGDYSPTFRRWFDATFSPGWVHVVVHALLFAGLMLLLFTVLRLPLQRKTVLGGLAAALAAGMLQEGFQIFSSGFFEPLDSLFDLGVDVSGAALGVLLLYAMRKKAAVLR
jgi:hypothetical protein